MVEAIPSVHYVVSRTRSQTIETSAGVYSVHPVAPGLFGGFDETRPGVFVATAEKALFDLASLSGGRTRRFAGAPEVELPAGFRRRELARWVSKIASVRARTLTEARLERFLRRVARRARATRPSRR